MLFHDCSAACIARHLLSATVLCGLLSLLKRCQREVIDLKCLTLGRELPSGKKVVMKHAIPATMLLIAKGRRRPKRSIVTKIRRAAGSSTAPEMKNSRKRFPPTIPMRMISPW